MSEDVIALSHEFSKKKTVQLQVFITSQARVNSLYAAATL